MASEASARRAGGETVITRLADILVIQAVRAWIDQHADAQPGWLAALRDPQLGRVIQQVHQSPGRPWTVDTMAREAGMSRSVFASRFSTVVGESAMHFVARWRMNVAMTTLRDDRVTIAAVAEQLGYNSEAAFSRAFKRVVGRWPGEARRPASAATSPA
jgi:transcriptional regulator GlxA family with amidase domain